MSTLTSNIENNLPNNGVALIRNSRQELTEEESIKATIDELRQELFIIQQELLRLQQTNSSNGIVALRDRIHQIVNELSDWQSIPQSYFSQASQRNVTSSSAGILFQICTRDQ